MTAIDAVQFAKPGYALALVLVPFVVALSAYAFSRKRRALNALASAEIRPRLALGFDAKRHWRRTAAVAAAVLCMVLALMQPQWGQSVEEVPRRGRDLLFLLDVSLSMLAEDAKPSRLNQAKSAIRGLIDRLGDEGGHRLGLVAFAGRASLQSPLTLDYAFFLERLDDAGPHVVAQKGTAVGDALRKVVNGVNDLNHEHADIIILTDGEDHGSLAIDAARNAARQGVSVYTIGIGDPHAGARIPLPREIDAAPEYLRRNEQDVISRVRPELLLELAAIGNGAYLSAYVEPVDLVAFYRDHIADKPRRAINTGASEGYAHRFQWFVLAALALLLAEMLWSDRRARAPRANFAHTRSAAGALIVVVTCVLLVVACREEDVFATALEQANDLYRSERFADAAEHYRRLSVEHPQSAEVQYNLANAAFRQYDYATAIEHYLLALKTDDRALASQVRYNLGNTMYQRAVDAMLSFQDALTPLRAATEHYRESLTLDAGRADAKYNLELAHRLLREIENQRVRAQENAEIRNQQTSRNEGQAFDEQSNTQDRAEDGDQDKPPDAKNTPQNQQGEQAPGASGAPETSPQASETGRLNEMSPEQAEELVQAARQQAADAETERRQWRNARMRDRMVEKDW